MQSLRRSIARVYGPSAITWWTWLITLPFAFTVMSGLQYVTGGPAAVVAVAALQHAILGGLLLVGVAVLRVIQVRGRAIAVFTIFAVVGGVRPLLFLEAGGLLHIPVAPGQLFARMATNAVVLLVSFSLIAVGVDLVREHRGVFRRLRAAQRASEIDVECARERLARLRSAAVDDVVAALEEAAMLAAVDRLEPLEGARVLRALAEDVVRPASHRVYEDEPVVRPPDSEPLGRWEWTSSVLAGTRAAPPVTTTAVFMALVLPFAVSMFGVDGLLPMLFGAAVLLTAVALVAVVPLPRDGVLRILTLLVLYVPAGLLLAAASAIGLSAVGAESSPAWFEAITFPVIALGIAFVASLSARVRQDQAELEEALRANVQTAMRIRQDYERERASLARLLHAGVQSELIAGALMLTATPAEGSATTAVRVAEVVGRARDALRTEHDDAHAADEVRALIESWSSAIDLRARIADGVWDRLADPARASAAVDAMSEGLANAVRHGDGSPVAIELRPAATGGVEVVIESGGTLEASRSGIGLRQLSERGEVSLRASAGRVELAVDIP
ncbi:hypothetical protein [Leifsonia sp. LS-T14]|uniref:hypothetical protein n=1 Tax=unclassified Leifsonia TaxID=2663824 RepID=UPI0035A67826